MTVEQIATQFALGAEFSGVKPLGEGFINDTFIVETDGKPEFILQRKNHVVFPNVPAMMENIRMVTEHIRRKVSPEEKESATIEVVPTKDGKLYFQDPQGNYWAVCKFIRESACYDRVSSPEIARQGGIGLGVFHRQVSDFKEPLVEIIKGFHNIRWRFIQWDESVKRDAAGRVKDLKEEISWIESRREGMMEFWGKFESGEIPTRAIHGDTKISNFLFSSKDGHLLCAIDLDTMMSSTLLCDTGDALRAYTNTGAEDDSDLSKVSMSMDYFKAYMGGYLSEMKPYLSASELEYLAFSGIYITYEQVLRFLMDYIDGDTYYKTKSPDHNLVRTRAQYKLLTSMEEQLPAMKEFILAQ